MNIRFLETGANPAAYNMGLDETLMQGVKAGEPVLRFYQWKPPAVSIGTFQKIEDEVDREACARQGVDVVRRITGGGAVFHDAELTYSFISREYPPNIIESYKWVCGGIIRGLDKLGIEARFAPINDVLVGAKKVSGNAQTRKKGVLLQHGTLLLDVDAEKMFSLLKVPDEKMKGKMISSVKERVVALSKPYQEASWALQKGFAEALGGTLASGPVTEWEEVEARRLAKEKYSAREWNYMR